MDGGGVRFLVFRNELPILVQSRSFGFFKAQTEFFKGFLHVMIDFLKFMD